MENNEAGDRQEKLRQALIESVGAEDVAAIAKVLIEKAKGGDLKAARLLLSYALGKPGGTREKKERPARGAECPHCGKALDCGRGLDAVERPRRDQIDETLARWAAADAEQALAAPADGLASIRELGVRVLREMGVEKTGHAGTAAGSANGTAKARGQPGAGMGP